MIFFMFVLLKISVVFLLFNFRDMLCMLFVVIFMIVVLVLVLLVKVIVFI